MAADFNFNEDVKKWSLYTELMYRSMSRDIHFAQAFSDSNSELKHELDMDLKVSALHLATLLRRKFVFQNKKVVPFINIGVGLSLYINNKSTELKFEQAQIKWLSTKTHFILKSTILIIQWA